MVAQYCYSDTNTIQLTLYAVLIVCLSGASHVLTQTRVCQSFAQGISSDSEVLHVLKYWHILACEIQIS